MKIKRWALIIAILLWSYVSTVQGAEVGMPAIPFERFGGHVQQQSKNLNRSLFQDDKIGDLREKRSKAMKDAYKKSFQYSTQPWNPKKTLFRQNTYRSKDYTHKKITQKKSTSHYGRFSFIVISIGVLLSLLSIKRGKKQCPKQ